MNNVRGFAPIWRRFECKQNREFSAKSPHLDHLFEQHRRHKEKQKLKKTGTQRSDNPAVLREQATEKDTNNSQMSKTLISEEEVEKRHFSFGWADQLPFEWNEGATTFIVATIDGNGGTYCIMVRPWVRPGTNDLVLVELRPQPSSTIEFLHQVDGLNEAATLWGRSLQIRTKYKWAPNDSLTIVTASTLT